MEGRERMLDNTCGQIENWVKSVMISWFVSEGSWVCELYPGTGEEAGKWQRAKIQHLTVIDTSKENLEAVIQRYERKKFPHMPLTLLADPTSSISWNLPIDQLPVHIPARPLTNPSFQVFPEAMSESHSEKYHVVACFHGTGLAFREETHADTFIENISASLMPGGIFMGLMADSSALFTRVHKTKSQEGIIRAATDDFELVMPNQSATESFAGYFQKNPFIFRPDNVGKDQPTQSYLYLVHCPTLIRICAKHNLRMVEIINLHEFYEENRKLHENTLKKMLGALKVHGKHIVRLGLFTMFAFQKTEVSLADNNKSVI
jgi:mRNA (guanine-N7-)-methyltransferase